MHRDISSLELLKQILLEFRVSLKEEEQGKKSFQKFYKLFLFEMKMSGKVKNIKSEKEFNSLIKDGNVLVDFYADWCGPCKILSPLIEKVSKDYDTVTFAKVDVDSNQELSQRFQIMSIPTVIFFKNGKQVERFSGAIPEDDLREKIDEVF